MNIIKIIELNTIIKMLSVIIVLLLFIKIIIMNMANYYN